MPTEIAIHIAKCVILYFNKLEKMVASLTELRTRVSQIKTVVIVVRWIARET